MIIRLHSVPKAVPGGVGPRVMGVALLTLALAGCSRSGDIDATGGIVAVRSPCPSAAVAAHTGSITLFDPPQSREARAIDVVADITELRSTCSEAGSDFYSEASFQVQARRSDPTGARQVVLPYFSTVVRGGSTVVAKRVGQVTINFAPGEYRASAAAKASAYVDRASATLPEDIRERITRRREPGDTDAAVDPFSEPDVRAALQRTTFELLVGFNLTADQLKYNVTR